MPRSLWEPFVQMLAPYAPHLGEELWERLGNKESLARQPWPVYDEALTLDEEKDIGYTPGYQAYDLGLTDFPYDYQRLYNYRVFVWHNARLDVSRMVGAAILANYCKDGGGLVLTTGDNALTWEYTDPANPLNDFIPIVPKEDNLFKGALQLNSPAPDHPIFRGVNMTALPWAFWTHDVALKPGPAKVLLKVGDRPFIVELSQGEQRTMVVLAAPFGGKTEFPGKVPFWEWPEWPKLYANIVRYAGHEQ